MSKGVYVTLTVVACILLLLIPTAGLVLAVTLMVAAIVFWSAQKVQDVWSYVPRPPQRYVDTPLTFDQEVVGESFYQAGIARFVAGYGRDVQATFTHEPGNPRDGSAVRVDLVADGLSETCGYLPAAVAADWVPVVRAAAVQGDKLRVPAVVRGGRESAPSFGVWLVTDARAAQASRPARVSGSRSGPGPRFEPVRDEVQEFWSEQKPQLVQETRANKKPDIDRYVEDVALPAGSIDLRHLDARRLRIVGTGHHVAYEERIEAWTYLLRREPKNRHDSNAIAVHLLDGRHVGYVSAKQAESYAPLLDRLGSEFVVCGVGSEGTTSSRLWIDLPRVPELRKLVDGS